MIYHCKKCGAVVSGKFCSCCGTRATTDLEDFRKEMRSRKKEFVGGKTQAKGAKYFIQLYMADAAWHSSEAAVLENIKHLMFVDEFHRVSEMAWNRIPEIVEKAERLYDGTMLLAAAIFKEAK